VFRGRQPGVYSSWRICQAQLNGFSKNDYKGYQTLEEAEEEFNQFLVDEARGESTV
jgi:ribonuclease HI